MVCLATVYQSLPALRFTVDLGSVASGINVLGLADLSAVESLDENSADLVFACLQEVRWI